MERSRILTVNGDAGPEKAASALLTREDTKAILVDDLNSLNALIGRADRNSSGHKFFVLMRLLSYNARVHNIALLASVYKNQRLNRNSRRSLAASTDLQINVETKASYITFRCESIGAWPDKGFTVSL